MNDKKEYQPWDAGLKAVEAMEEEKPSTSGSDGLLCCPECERTEKDLTREGFIDDTCAIVCKCGFRGPSSDWGQEAEQLWNELPREK